MQSLFNNKQPERRTAKLFKKHRKSVLIGGITAAVIGILYLFPHTQPRFIQPLFRSQAAECRDGSTSYSLSRSGTCSNHGGVRYWTK